MLLPEQVPLWLLRAWGRFRKSKFANRNNYMRRGSSIFMLESRGNWVGKFS